jgi:hypothetical protein
MKSEPAELVRWRCSAGAIGDTERSLPIPESDALQLLVGRSVEADWHLRLTARCESGDGHADDPHDCGEESRGELEQHRKAHGAQGCLG